ncbi:GGDEF domain-containing protein, partial [Klebsiella pneumoniae]
VAQRTAQLEELVEEVKRMSLTDALTGCLNRRAMDERLASEVAQGQRLGAALSVMFVDVDRFKQVNDRHGHAAGDAVLREVA